MNINIDISSKSWGDISEDLAKNYLHNYPVDMKIELSKFISTVNPAPSILDIGCGNAQMYTILKRYNDNIRYVGIDISKPLLEAAKSVVKNDAFLVETDIYKYMMELNESFDFAIISHMLECIESPELIIAKASEKCEYIAIHWFDTPKYEYDAVTIASNPHSQESFKPYIRRKIGKNYWKYITDMYYLKLIKHSNVDQNNVLEIYKKQWPA